MSATRPTDAPDPADRHAWERPGAHEVGPGVHRVPLPLPGDALKAVNVYVIDDGDGLVLVDGGWAMVESQQALERGLDEIGHRLSDIREFLVTHVHRDHYTQAVALRRVTGASVGLGAGEKVTLDAFRVPDSRSGIRDLQRAGAAELAALVERFDSPPDLTDWEYPDHWLDDAQELTLQTRTLRVVATPGHTSGHVVFHDPAAGALFAGDHVLPHITPSLAVEWVRPESPLRDYLTSLRIVLAMPDARLLPAHGPVSDSTHARVDELLRHHDRRLTETLEAVAAGASTGFEVASRLGWTRRAHRLADLDTFNSVLAVHETMAHLQVLVEQGQLRRTDVDDVAHFAVA